MNDATNQRDGPDVLAQDHDVVAGPIVIDAVGVTAGYQRAICGDTDDPVGDQVAINAEQQDHARLDVVRSWRKDREIAAGDGRRHRAAVDGHEPIPRCANDARAKEDGHRDQRRDDQDGDALQESPDVAADSRMPPARRCRAGGSSNRDRAETPLGPATQHPFAFPDG
jgi:hypothetical protein